MDHWNPLWSGIVNSSAWGLENHVRILWVTMLALKDRNQMVYGNAYGLARQANLSEQETIEALKVLESPDNHRIEKQEFDGRRIARVENDGNLIGWLILNGRKYQDLMGAAWRRAYRREWMRQFREKKDEKGRKTLEEKVACDEVKKE